ncbi:MAG: carbohydrate ABC transporter permease [Candidatus Bipolaricaulota bacterium]
MIFVVGTIPITTAIAIILAVFLNQKIKFRGFFRASYFVPVMTSVVVISTIFTYIYSPYGLLNSLLNLFGIPGKNWLLNTNFALPAIMVMMIWASFGYYTVLFLAGLQNIPEEIYESAAIDGANTVQTFFRITLPLLRPMLIFALVINIIRSFQIFSQIFVMTQGGPLGSTRTIVYYLYNMGFQKFRMGYASGIAYLLFILILIFSVIQMKSLSYEEQFYD